LSYKDKNRAAKLKTTAAFIILAVVFSLSTKIFLEARTQLPIYPSKGLTKIVKLSNYFAKLKNTDADSDIYIYDSGKPGATFLIFGGTHNDEPAGHLSAVTLIENIKVKSGRVFIVPKANQSGLTHTTPLEAYPEKYKIETPKGVRWFKFGSRYSNPIDQWPDPDIYVHKQSGQALSGEESRNLNRAWPGKPDGTFTEKLAYAYISLIKKEKVDVSIDLHEALLEYFLINAICYHEHSNDVAVLAGLNLSAAGLNYTLEASPPNLHGFFHRELGDYTKTMPILMETPNPIEGRFHGPVTNDLVVKGQDRNYIQAGKMKRLFVPMDENGWPISLRVARHIKGIQELINAFNVLHPAKKILVENVPSYEQLVHCGVGKFLHAPVK
jgi:predicted deacylase